MSLSFRNMFNKAKEQVLDLGFNCDKVLYIGNDMLNDIYPSKKIGFKTMLFAGDKRSLRLREEDKKAQEFSPDAIITELNDILNYI